MTEDDDEFLRKKAVAVEKPPPPPKKKPVRISIPSLSDFKDLDDETTSKKIVAPINNKPSGLLNMLPKPKAEQLFQTAAVTPPGMIPPTTTRSLVPHSVAKKAVAVKRALPDAAVTGKSSEKRVIPDYCESSDEDDGEEGHVDFFSLSGEKEALPTVSKNEINLMVAKRAARIAETTAKFDQLLAREEQERMEMEEAAVTAQQSLIAEQETSEASGFDEEALQSLIGGSRAKRARMGGVDMIELSHEQVMPSRDEWQRTSVASSTTAQVRGQLKDGPKGVAKKKHQITYLAHQAKSNEAELQAIWAANRTTQRQSQSKYGW